VIALGKLIVEKSIAERTLILRAAALRRLGTRPYRFVAQVVDRAEGGNIAHTHTHTHILTSSVSSYFLRRRSVGSRSPQCPAVPATRQVLCAPGCHKIELRTVLTP